MKNFFKKYELAIVVVVFTLLRFISASFMGLMPQDAYYTYYSSNLSLSYFDHPPMVAYMIKLFTLLGGKNVVALHVGDLIVTALTIALTYSLLKKITTGNTLKRASILFVSAPLLTVLSINTTPDVPLMFFWALSLIFIYNAISKNGTIWWILAGLASGLAFESKYTGIFLPMGVFLFLILSDKHRKLILSDKSLFYIIAFIIAVSPVIIWNFDNNFISFKYQSAERAAGMSIFSIKPKLFAGFFGTQLVLALPLLFLSLFPATYTILQKYLPSFWSSVINGKWRGYKKEKVKDNEEFKRLFAASFTLPVFVLFTVVALIYWVKLNWLMPVYISGVALSALIVKSDKLIRIQTLFSLILHILIIVQIVRVPIKINSDDTWQGWEELAQKTKEISLEKPDHFIFSDNSYKVSAVLNFYLDKHVYAGNVVGADAFQFALDDKDLSSLKGKSAIYVTTARFEKKRQKTGGAGKILAPYFASVQPIDSLILKNSSGEILRRFYFFDCSHYKGETKTKNL